MKKTLLALAALVVAGMGNSAMAGLTTICPTGPNINSGGAGSECAFLITITGSAATGYTFTGALTPGATPYDGADDSLIGVINNASDTFTGSISLSSNVDIFGFDADGICNSSYSTGATGLGYCSANDRAGVDPGDYAGPINTFTIVDSDNGTVNITGLAAGDNTFFSLEENLAGFGTTVTVGAPEPATFAMIGGGLGLLALVRRRKK